MQVDFPYHFDGRERTAETDEEEHVRDLIEQVLFTMPGERVNRPDFGAAVMQLVFGPASPEAAATAEFMIRGALQQHLGRRIAVEEVATAADDATLSIRVSYRLLATGRRVTADFEREGGQ